MKIKKIEINFRARVHPLRERILAHIKSPFFRDTVTQLLLIPSVFLTLTAWILAIYHFGYSDYLVPQRYNSFLGVYSLGQWYDSYVIPALLTVCLLANVTLGKKFYEKDKFLGYILVASNIFLAIVVVTVIINFGRLLD
jgi:hypothetical protein